MIRFALIVALVLAAAAALGGAAVVVSGVASISAVEGHWRPTAWLLEFAKRRSVATHSARIATPPLDSDALILRGAGHFESACRRCHGAPGGGSPQMLRYLVPRPPNLLFAPDRYSPAELFYIVRNGIKLSGMPGWAAPERDDEVWAMVAFLQLLPSLTPERYAALVHGDTLAARETPGTPAPDGPASDAPAVVGTLCARCHGFDGLGRIPGAFPKLAGQTADYLYLSLRAYAYGGRHSGIMGPVAADLTDRGMREAAEYYAQLPGLTAAPSPPVEASARAIAERGIPSRRVAACLACHRPAPPFNPVYPRLGGQYAEYLELQLALFAERRRGGTAYAHLMHLSVDGLTPDERREVARYFGTPTEVGPASERVGAASP